MRARLYLISICLFAVPLAPQSAGAACTQLEQKARELESFSRLQSRAKSFIHAHEVPGGSGAASILGEGHYILTLDIHPEDLPYSTVIRPARSVRPIVPLDLRQFHEIPKDEIEVTDIFFTSEHHGGSGGLVRLGRLSDGRPVALKTELRMPNSKMSLKSLKNAQSAYFASEIGIGPEFHGIYIDPKGRVNVVTDIAVGDFVATHPDRIIEQTFQDLETMIHRMRQAGVLSVPDFQFLMNERGRLFVIDPGFLLDPSVHGTAEVVLEPGRLASDFEYARKELIRGSGAALASSYLEYLKSADPVGYAKLKSFRSLELPQNVTPMRITVP